MIIRIKLTIKICIVSIKKMR